MNPIFPIVFLIILFTGLFMALLGSVRLLISAFRKSIVWGLGCLLVPFCGLVYIVVDWENAKSGFFLYLKGIGVLLASTVLAVVLAPNFKAKEALQRVHARQQASASASDKEQSAPASPEKSKSLTSLFQKKQPSANPPRPALRLQGISFNPTKPSAIINGNTLFVGENVAGWTVTAISNQTVTLQDESGQTNTLSLH